ncbi:MAG: hypothetical protein Alpg2KO_10040 [Alphaproteobacteria bacterium]
MSRSADFFSGKAVKAMFRKGKSRVKEVWSADREGKGTLITGLGLSALLVPVDPMAAADCAASVTSVGSQNSKMKEELARARHAGETGEGLDDLSGRHSAFSVEGVKEMGRSTLVELAEMATSKPDARTWGFLGGLAITTAISSVPIAGPATIVAVQVAKQVIRKEADHRAWKAAEEQGLTKGDPSAPAVDAKPAP